MNIQTRKVSSPGTQAAGNTLITREVHVSRRLDAQLNVHGLGAAEVISETVALQAQQQLINVLQQRGDSEAGAVMHLDYVLDIEGTPAKLSVVLLYASQEEPRKIGKGTVEHKYVTVFMLCKEEVLPYHQQITGGSVPMNYFDDRQQ